MVKIIDNINNIIHFKLTPIITENKPGELIDLNLKNICLKLNIQFHFTKSFYINELNSIESRGKHSNDNCSELLICLNGSLDIKLHNGKNEFLFEGKTEGKIPDTPKGEGFGWDAIFVPNLSELSYAEMSSKEKNKISQRRLAIEQLKKHLENEK